MQARKYRGLILRFNEDVRERDLLHSAAYLFNLHRRDPEPLEDWRFQHMISDSKLFLANDVGLNSGSFWNGLCRENRRRM